MQLGNSCMNHLLDTLILASDLLKKEKIFQVDLGLCTRGIIRSKIILIHFKF